jgi:hypothetical protein
MDDSSDSSDSDIDWVLPLLSLATFYPHRQPRIASNRLYSSEEYVDNLLNCGNDIRIRDQLCMRLDTFYSLRDWLVNNTKLKSSQKVSIKEKLVAFIYIASIGASNRQA